MPSPSLPFSDDTRHFLVYVPWRTILDWRRAEAKMGQAHPYAYATRLKKPYEYLREGDAIWIITVPYYGHYGSFPSLDTLLVVKDKWSREDNGAGFRQLPGPFKSRAGNKPWPYAFTGGEYSCHFPLNNCLDLLLPLLSEKATHNLMATTHKGYGYLGMVFQHGRNLDAEQGKSFLEYQQAMVAKKALFISYRYEEEPEGLAQLLEGLLHSGIPYQLDLNRTPGGSKLTALKKRPAAFKEALLSAVAQCDGLLALESETYWQSFWTGLEFGAAQAMIKVKPEFAFLKHSLSMMKTKAERLELIEEVSQCFGEPP